MSPARKSTSPQHPARSRAALGRAAALTLACTAALCATCPPAASAQPRSAVVASAAPAQAVTDGSQTGTVGGGTDGGSVQGGDTGQGGGQVKYYVVQPPGPDGPQTLSMIAQQTLGDADLFQKIFDLNKGRLEPDGQRVKDPMLLQPGWVLELPPQATGTGVMEGTLANAMGQSPSTAPQPTAAPPSAAAKTSTTTTTTNKTVPTAAVWAGLGTGAASLAGGTLLVVLRRSRARRAAPGTDAKRQNTVRPRRPETPGAVSMAEARTVAPVTAGTAARPHSAEATLTFAAPITEVAKPVLPRRERAGKAAASGRASGPAQSPDTAELSTIDRALRVLALSCETTGRPLPHPYAVALDSGRIRMNLSPADIAPPAPWTAAEDGRTWELDPARLEGLRAAAEAPFPHLVLIRSGAAGRVAINLDRAFGIVALDGVQEAARDLAADFAGQLIRNPWARDNQGTVVGLGLPEDADAASADIRTAPSVARFLHNTRPHDATLTSAALLGGGSGVQRDATSVMVLQGRRPGENLTRRGGFVVVDGTVSPDEAAALATLAADAEAPWAVVVTGAVPNARWTCEVSEDGTVGIDVLGFPSASNG
jgi:hypothetical protein